MNIERYKSLLTIPEKFDLPNIKSYIPQITDEDLQNGFITRYFVQKANDDSSPIIEISDNLFSNFHNNPFYKVTFLDWKLTGTKAQIKESNFQSVKLASKDFKNLYIYLPNYLQFAEPNLEM